MKSLKLLLSVIAMVSFAAAPVLRAEAASSTPPTAGATHHKGHHGEHLKKLAEKLGLTEAQIAQIKPILKDEKQAKKALKADAALDKKTRHAKMKEIRQSHREQILAILTPEQQAQFKAMREQHKHKRGVAS